MIKKRDEIPNEYKWNIEEMYSTIEAWNEDFEKVSSMSEEFVSFNGKFLESGKSLYDALLSLDNINRLLENLYVFAKMKQDEDNSNSTYQELNGRILSLISQVGADQSFFSPQLMELTEEKFDEFLEETPQLKTYDFMIREILKSKEHILSEKEEKILSQLSEVTSGAHQTFTMLNNADMTFGTIEDESGKEIPLTHGNYINFMESHRREIREAAFTKMYKAYESHINTIGTLYSTSVKNDVVESEIRNYKSSLDKALSPNEIPESVYYNLVEVINSYLPTLHKYINLRKEILGVDKLQIWDVYVPLVKVPEKNISYEEAIKIINKALEPMGEDYLAKMNKGISQGWIDVYENKGKTSGAYSFGSYDSYPYILMNYTNKLQDVLTLIHEMGHSMHSLYTRENQPFAYGDYSIFVAEVASTVNECLLLHYLLEKEENKEMKIFLLNRFIEEFRSTVFRQTMFAEFELLVHKYVEEGGALTPDYLSEEYEKLNSKYFGEAIEKDDYIKYEWSRIPHFYRAFYVYQYATGFSAATALSKRILTRDPEKVNAYKKFLSMGSSAHPVEELKVAGVDMSKKSSIVDAMEFFKELVEEFESLIKE